MSVSTGIRIEGHHTLESEAAFAVNEIKETARRYNGADNNLELLNLINAKVNLISIFHIHKYIFRVDNSLGRKLNIE